MYNVKQHMSYKDVYVTQHIMSNDIIYLYNTFVYTTETNQMKFVRHNYVTQFDTTYTYTWSLEAFLLSHNNRIVTLFEDQSGRAQLYHLDSTLFRGVSGYLHPSVTRLSWTLRYWEPLGGWGPYTRPMLGCVRTLNLGRAVVMSPLCAPST